MGNFDYRIDWDSMAGVGSSEEFLNVIQNGFFIQLVREPRLMNYFKSGLRE